MIVDSVVLLTNDLPLNNALFVINVTLYCYSKMIYVTKMPKQNHSLLIIFQVLKLLK